jgi:hypothetical protein
VYALNGTDGTENWNFTTDDFVFSSPTVLDGTVYVGSYDGNVYALNGTDGTENWNFTTGGGVFSSPTVLDGTVYVGSDDGNVYGLDASDGGILGQFSTGGTVSSSPTVVDGTVYVGSDDGDVYALDTEVTGTSEGSRVELGTLGHTGSFAGGPSVFTEELKIAGSSSSPKNIPTNQGGFDNEKYEDLDGDGDPTDTGSTVIAFGKLLRDESLQSSGFTDEQARALNWNPFSPETELRPSDMVTLFGKQLRAG